LLAPVLKSQFMPQHFDHPVAVLQLRLQVGNLGLHPSNPCLMIGGFPIEDADEEPGK
jgi:hypothetical protein